MSKITKSFIIVLVAICGVIIGATSMAQVTHGDAALVGERDYYNKGLLWKISKPDVKVSYLFGTIHSEDQRVLRVLSQVEPLLRAADILAVEMELTAENSLIVMQSMVFTDGRKLPSLIGEALFEKTRAIAKRHGLAKEQIVLLKPWAVSTILSMPKAKTGKFMDKILYDQAQQQGKPILGLETAQEQITVLNGLAMEEQIALLDEVIEHYDAIPSMQEELIAAYVARDLAVMEALYDKYMSTSTAQLEKKIRVRLLVERNARMVARMKPLIEKGNSVVAVGALHLPGDDGLLTLLRKRGYSVERMY